MAKSDKNKFHGTYEQLQEQVRRMGYVGKWSESKGGKKTFQSQDGAFLNWWEGNETIQFQGAKQAKEKFEQAFLNFEDSDDGDPSLQSPSIQPRPSNDEEKKIFIVHGHDDNLLTQLQLVIRCFGLQPIVLRNENNQSTTIIEDLQEQISKNAAFAVVLMTPDDMGYSKGKEKEVRPRARQNVILEMGMVLTQLGRTRTVILTTKGKPKDEIEIPSDIAGVKLLKFENDIKEVVTELGKNMQGAGIGISDKQIVEASNSL